MRQTVLNFINDPWATGSFVPTDESDVPQPIREELFQLSCEKRLSYYYLCAIYRQGRKDSESKRDDRR